MSHDQLRRMLGDSAAGVDVGPAPVFVAAPARARRPWVRVGLVVAALVVAGVVVARATGGDDQVAAMPEGATRVPTLNSDYTADESATAVISGRLARGDSGCLALARRGDAQSVAWPPGWVAYADAEGVVGLYDETGARVARLGDRIEAGGAYYEGTDRYVGQPCAPDGDVAEIQSEVTVERGE